jgi:hypothetical protein
MKTQTIHLVSSQIESAVRAHYASNGFIVLSQVRNGTGFEKKARTADMLAVSTWPSRGLYAEGIEIKSSSGDLRRELANGQKADDIARYCREWWIACPQGVSDGLKIPPAWGILSVDSKLKAKVIKSAEVLTPEPMDALFVCSVLRNFAENYVALAEVQPRIKDAVEMERKNLDNFRTSRVLDLENGYQQFKEHTGIDLLSSHGHPIWDMKGCGEAIRLLMNMRSQPASEILKAKAHLESGIKAIEAALAVVDTSPKLEE